MKYPLNHQVCLADRRSISFDSDIADSFEDSNIITIDEEVIIFRACKEMWENKKIGPDGDDIFEARLVRKYGGLQWLDPDHNYSLRTAHLENMSFEKKYGNNKYHILACKEGFDIQLPTHVQEDKYDVWERSADFYEQVMEYNKDNAKFKGYEEGGMADSGEE